MPEHNGLDMLVDLKDLKDWIFNDLQTRLGSDIEVDLDKILIEGDSAGNSSILELLQNLTVLQEAILLSNLLSTWGSRQKHY